MGCVQQAINQLWLRLSVTTTAQIPTQAFTVVSTTIRQPLKGRGAMSDLNRNSLPTNPGLTFGADRGFLLHRNPHTFAMAGKFRRIHTLDRSNSITKVAGMRYK